ncbi:MAG: universal stress protein [Phycicoccus sp.]|nr:universal stress protein [Phycicoccus sp.]
MWAFPGHNGTVVVGCDSSGESQNAVVEATREASRRGAELVLLSVAEHRPYWPDSLVWVSRAEAESTQQAQASADSALASALATDRSVAARIAIVHKADSLELDDMARQTGLLVLGGRGDGGQPTFALGSTSAELGRRFHCPILVVHDQGQPVEIRRFGPDSVVVVGIDFTAAVDAVLAVAAAEALIRGLPLVVVHALPRGKDADRAAIGEGWRKCREALREAPHPPGVPNRLVITQDDPVPALLHRVGHPDVLVVGAHGRGRLAGLVAGSVSRAVLDKMSCDVMVVQPDVNASEAIPTVLAGRSSRS